MSTDQPTPADEPADDPAASPTPTPDATTRPTRGAGFDDDEWVRRDLGPRPDVPDHGRRPLLMGLPILLITIAAVVAILVAGCGDDEDTPPASGAGSTPSAQSGGEPSTAKVVAALKSGAAGLAGRAKSKALADITCEPVDGAAADFRCAFGADGSPDSGAIRLRLQSDGTVTKILGSDPPTAGQKTSAQTQELLAAEDAASGGSKVTYACATSTGVNPDGTSAGSSASGQRCVLLEGTDKVAGQRYVQFAPDGTASRDFLLSLP